MPFLRQVRLFPAINGSVVKYDYFDKTDQFGNMEFISTFKEIFEDDSDAIKRTRELFEAKNNLDTHSVQEAVAAVAAGEGVEMTGV